MSSQHQQRWTIRHTPLLVLSLCSSSNSSTIITLSGLIKHLSYLSGLLSTKSIETQECMKPLSELVMNEAEEKVATVSFTPGKYARH